MVLSMAMWCLLCGVQFKPMVCTCAVSVVHHFTVVLYFLVSNIYARSIVVYSYHPVQSTHIHFFCNCYGYYC